MARSPKALGVQNWKLDYSAFRWACSDLGGQHQDCLHVLFEIGCFCLACLCMRRLNFLLSLPRQQSQSLWGTIWSNSPCLFLCSCHSFFYPDTQDFHRFSLFLSLERYVPACRNRPNVLLKVIQRIFGQVGLVQYYKVPCVLASAVPHWSGYCCCLGFLCSFQETGKGQILLSCEATLLTCQELCRMHRS